MFETIWIFIKMLFQWVALPALGIYLLIKLFFLLFNKLGNSFYDKRAEKKKEKELSAVLSRAHTEDEKKLVRYFLYHDEEKWSDMDYTAEMKALWKEGNDNLETPEENGRNLSMAFDEEFNLTDPDKMSLLRRKPDGETVSSRKERLSVYFGNENLYIRTLTLDMMKKECKAETVSYDYKDILDVSFQRLHPIQMINGNESRVLSSTLSILAKGGKRRTWKGIDYDTEPLVEMIREELDIRKDR